MFWGARFGFPPPPCFRGDAGSLSASRRATMSLGPPVGDGTMMRMFLTGYAVWLCAQSGKTATANAATAACRQRPERREVRWRCMKLVPLLEAHAGSLHDLSVLV